ncbi:TPA: hypothetical protein M4Y55_001632 [Klebsiella pneumoniae]|nr:hypothetical protein [Klebsiella pneumoniae]HCU0958668.1 hypothetical protein [Klebsiella pneumoniae]HDK5937929.1 hypothetical protein [Klebsiella pneumoniae]HEL3133463.1 hypothetical protein [Klebsiella pneumoniae]
MTKSTITRERLLEIIVTGPEASGAEQNELARMALAAMDSEPVILYRQVNPVNGMKTYWAELDPEEFRHLKKYTDENAEFMTLYRHAQPAPVVPEEMTPEMMRSVQLNSELGAYAASNLSGAYDLFAEFWKVACRAAMLNGGKP